LTVADEMNVRLDEAEHSIRKALDKEADIIDDGGVDHEGATQRHRVDLNDIAVDVRLIAHPLFGLQEEVQPLRRRKGVLCVVGVGGEGRQELGKERHQVDQEHNNAADQRQLVFAKAPPGELPL
jgi:hypothetical protein